VLLPASTWGEKHGTVTNSERRITHVNAVLPPPGEARHDWAIAVEFARRLQARLYPRAPTLFDYDGPEAIFNEHRATTAGRDLDITGLDYALLDRAGPQQWPFRAGATVGDARLYDDGVFATPSGRATFRVTAYRAVADAVDARFPLALTTGRLRDQWHGMSRTGRVPQLYGHEPEPMLTMNPNDIARRGLTAGEVVRVASRRGQLLIRLAASDDVRSGQCYVPMHWGRLSLAASGSHGINALTVPVCDPVSKQPELKHAAVRVGRAALPWSLVAFAYVEGGRDPVAVTDELREVAQDLSTGAADFFASTTLIGNERPGVVLRLAASKAPDRTTLEQIDRVLGLTGPQTLSYDDARRNLGRRVRVEDGCLVGVRLAGDLAAEAWMRDYFLSGASIVSLRQQLLAGSATAPAGFTPRGRVVCNCFNVSEREVVDFCAAEITGAVAESSAVHLDRLQSSLRCGTNCGSCLPELRALVAQSAIAA